MTERKFTPYEGWEEDLRMLTAYVGEPGNFSSIPAGPVVVARRLSAAFESPMCAKVLKHYDNSFAYRFNRATDNRGYIICRLPAGHHPFSIKPGYWNTVRQWVDLERCCSKHAIDSIHSPGHVPDVPEDAWR